MVRDTKIYGGVTMFLILKTTDWKEGDYIKGNAIPFGWCEDNNRAIPKIKRLLQRFRQKNKEIFCLKN